MDDQGQKLQDLESALGLASAFEQFSQAADLKKELDDINANDVVKQILEVTDKSCHPLSISSVTLTHYLCIRLQGSSVICLPVVTYIAKASETPGCWPCTTYSACPCNNSMFNSKQALLTCISAWCSKPCDCHIVSPDTPSISNGLISIESLLPKLLLYRAQVSL